MNICFIGGGNMATALIGGLQRQAAGQHQIAVVEPDADKCQQLASQFGVQAAWQLDLAAGSDVLVLAVKPQQLREVAYSLQQYIAPTTLVISIAAGIRLADLQRWLGGHARLVRVMPNTPALVGAGVSGVYAAPEVDAAGRAAAEAVLSAVGSVVWVGEEDQIDAVTAVSGSGPAYVFYFIESLQEAAEKQGFDGETARRLALETFVGAVRLAQDSPESPATLRARVTSKGGTTERAISIMETAGVKPAIAEAVDGAAERSRELAAVLGAD